MRRRRIFRIISELAQKELDEIALFLDSPLHNEHPSLSPFYGAFRDYLESDLSEELSAEDFHKSYFPDKPFNPRSFDQKVHLFQKKLDEYLIWKEFKKATDHHPKFLLRAYENIKLDRQVEKSYRKYVQSTAKSSNQSTDQLYEGFKMGLIRLENLMRQPRRSGPTVHETYQAINENLEGFYFTSKIFLANGIATYNRLFGTRFKTNYIEEITRILSGKIHELPLITLVQYRAYLLQILTEPEERDAIFKDLKLQMMEHGSRLDPDVAKDVFTVLINYGLEYIALRDLELEEEIDDFFDFARKSGYLFEQGKISREYFKNIIHLKARLGKIEDAKATLNQLKGKISNDPEGHTLHFVQGLLQFYERDYTSCIHTMEKSLSELKKDIFFPLDAGVIQLRSIIAAPDFDPRFAENKYDAFRKNLSRWHIHEKISQKNFVLHKNTREIIRELIHLRSRHPEFPADKLKTIRKKILKINPMGNKRWFLQFIDEKLK